MAEALPPVNVKTRTAAPPERQLGERFILTTHRVFQSFDRTGKSLELLHEDLFDSRRAVALSALGVVGALADASSYPHVARLLASGDDEVRAAAIRALGRLPHPGALQALRSLLKTAHGESTRCEILDALAEGGVPIGELFPVAAEMACSDLAPASGRVRAARLLLRLNGDRALDVLLPRIREETVDPILVAAESNPGLQARVAGHLAPSFTRLPAKQRAAFLRLLPAVAAADTGKVLGAALSDSIPGVRRAAYDALGEGTQDPVVIGPVIQTLLEGAEPVPTLEDEAEQAIARLGQVPGIAARVAAPLRALVMERIASLYAELTATGRKVASDSHELGWLISRSTEYLEYYGNEELRSALVQSLKGGGSGAREQILRMLKATAARVEVRHFDGYSALAELAKNPRRSGAALVARELALVKFGKGRALASLVRAIRVAALFLDAASDGRSRLVLEKVWTWALASRLFRLAEAVRPALARIDPAWGVKACRECITPPIASKILAISSLQLLRELNPDLLEEAAIQLLGSQDDTYVTLNVVDALSSAPPSANGALARILLTRLRTAANREVAEKVAIFLGRNMTLDILGSVKELYRACGTVVRRALLLALESRLAADRLRNRDGAVELCYGILRGEASAEWRLAVVLLWKMGEADALKLLSESIAGGSDEECGDLLAALKGSLTPALVPLLAPLARRESELLQQALGKLLLSAADDDTKAGVVDLVRGIRSARGVDEEPIAPAEAEAAAQPDYRPERAAFRFEHEHIQELAVLFTDIVGYSRMAERLTPMQLAALMKEYESTVLAVTGIHEGELVKRMGDGHLFLFAVPLNAVLAAIRLQKSLRRFNRYRSEGERVLIRIGIHWGKLIRKEGGDVLGNTVNIASRLESAASPGSILVSDQLHEKVKESILSNEIGQITVKNIAGPITVFEPYEVALDLPAAIDPLRRARGSSPACQEEEVRGAPAAPVPPPSRGTVPVDREVLAEIARGFATLIDACRKVEAGEASVASLRAGTEQRWERIRRRLGAAAPREP